MNKKQRYLKEGTCILSILPLLHPLDWNDYTGTINCKIPGIVVFPQVPTNSKALHSPYVH